jgi:alpha-galactosidase
MLEVGNGGMTNREYRSHFSLWAAMAAPLLIGTDLRAATPETMEILLNREVIAVDQDPLGVQGTVLRRDNGHWVIVKPLRDGDIAVTLFNQSEATATFGATATELGLPRRPGYAVRDLWEHRSYQSAGTFTAAVPAHGTVMYRVDAGDRGWWRHPPLTEFALDLPAPFAGVPGTVTPAGQPFTANVTTVNRGVVPVLNGRVRLTPAPGWRVEPLGPTGEPLLWPGESLTVAFRVTPPATAPPGNVPLTARLSYAWLFTPEVRRTAGEELTVPTPVPAGTSDLGDLAWARAANGLGPVERNMSNGSAPAGDGKPLTINGRVYAKGLGTHAEASILYYLAGRCAALNVDVGIDDERDPRPDPTWSTAIFEIWADGVKVADSGLRTWQDDAVHLTADLTGASYVRIVTNGGPDGFRWDRGDWAAPVLACG